jgi:hypothetical protein
VGGDARGARGRAAHRDGAACRRGTKPRQTRGRGDALPIALALASLIGILAVRLQQRHLGRVFESEDGLVVHTLLGRRLVVRWSDVEGARVGTTPFRLPSRHPGFLRLR